MSVIKLAGFAGTVSILGKDRYVDFPDPEAGVPSAEDAVLRIGGLSVVEAETVLAMVADVRKAAEPAPAPPKEEPTKAETKPAAGKKAASKPATPPAETKKEPAKAAEPKPAPAKAAAKAPLDMPGDDGKEEEPADGKEEEPAEEDESGLLPVPEGHVLRGPAAKMRDVVGYLNERGYTTREQLLQGCEVLKPHVPILKNIVDVAERLERTLQVMGYQK